MKNIMRIFVVLVIFLGAISVSEANPLPDSEASLGGITLGGSMEYVKGIYGSPSESTWVTDTFGNRVLSHRYGNGFYILESLYGGKSYINELLSDRRNGVATPMGITVGISKNTVLGVYGDSPYKHGGEYSYTTVSGRKILISFKSVDGEEIVSRIHIRFAC